MHDAKIKPLADTADSDPGDRDYWHQLIDQATAAEFVSLSPKTLERYRWHGGGPQFVKLSSRCVRYRRSDLRTWFEGRLASSTADEPEAA